MTGVFLCFSFGVMLAGILPQLPSILLASFATLSVSAIAFLLRRRIPSVKLLCALVLGIGYGIAAGYVFLDRQLDDELAGSELYVEGKVIDLPQVDSRRQSFLFEVHTAYQSSHDKQYLTQFPRTISLSSFGDLRVKTGESWALAVKLKSPRGLVNPSGFDYQAYLIRRGIGATGYVRESFSNKLLMPANPWSIDHLRFTLQQWLLQNSESGEKGILIALLVGDTSQIDKTHWNEMLKTGTNHLIAISGLHVGFFAIAGYFLGNVIGRFIQLVWHRVASMVIGHVCAISFALFYSVLAGLNIPTLRTLIMLGVAQGVILLRRSFRGRDSLLLALVLVLLCDPLAAYDIGFWLSFIAVGLLIFCFSGRRNVQQQASFSARVSQSLMEFVQSQWVMFVGLLIPLSLMVHTSSLLAPVANFFAIPVITFFVVPSLIFSAIFHLMDSSLALFFLHLAELGLAWVHAFLQWLLIKGDGHFNPLINVNSMAVVLACVSVFIILLPRGLVHRGLGFCGLLLALIVPLKRVPDLQILVFDVGQGTAVLVRTPHHQLLYDTGPLYSERFDAGSALVVPYLQSQGLSSLDAIVVSHHDKDHSGGLAGVLASTTTEHLWLGEPDSYNASLDESETDQNSPADTRTPENCHTIAPWEWDGVAFRFITWAQDPHAKANNHSCVLLVEYQGHRTLLTGDIEKDVERQLLAENQVPSVDILLAPHHGSHTSSTAGFVAQTHPQFVVYSAGYRNQHGHPHKDVQERYAAIGAIPVNTASSGAVEFVWNAGEPVRQTEYRHSQRRYWYSFGAD